MTDPHSPEARAVYLRRSTVENALRVVRRDDKLAGLELPDDFETEVKRVLARLDQLTVLAIQERPQLMQHLAGGWRGENELTADERVLRQSQAHYHFDSDEGQIKITLGPADGRQILDCPLAALREGTR